MRGKRVSKKARTLDVVLVAVRYDGSNKRVSMVRGNERRGFVWSDQVLLDRKVLVDRMKAKKRVVAGRQADLEGDFEVYAPIHLKTTDQHDVLVAEGLNGDGDNLGLPLF